MTDPFVGRLSFFRVYSGTLKSGSYVLNANKGVKERIGRILQMHANNRTEIQEVFAGDIAAAVGLKNTTTGDTLCDEKHEVILEKIFLNQLSQLLLNQRVRETKKKCLLHFKS